MPKSVRIASNTTPSRLLNIHSYRTYWPGYAVNSSLNFQRVLHRQLLLMTQQYQRDLGSGPLDVYDQWRAQSSQKNTSGWSAVVSCADESIHIYVYSVLLPPCPPPWRSELHFCANKNSCNEEILQSPASCNASVGLRSPTRRGNYWEIPRWRHQQALMLGWNRVSWFASSDKGMWTHNRSYRPCETPCTCLFFHLIISLLFLFCLLVM